jgi:hypothetical protein
VQLCCHVHQSAVLDDDANADKHPSYVIRDAVSIFLARLAHTAHLAAVSVAWVGHTVCASVVCEASWASVLLLAGCT